MFGPLKYIFYAFILAALGYAALFILPSFINVDHVEITQEVTLPTPTLVDPPKETTANE